MRIPFLLLILILILFVIKSCKSEVKDPTDREMINHFNKCKTDFEMIKQIIADDTISAFEYPPVLFEGKYKNIKDSIYFNQLNIDKKRELDSLLQNVQCSGIFVLSNNEIRFNYYSYGGIGWGIDKNFIYTKRNFKEINDVEICPPEIDMSERRYNSMKNCYLVKELGNNWYIELNYDR
ncbi:hypothetical protein CGC59_02160 [Capnocytophaga sputigena]|jgi:hypothetical protein|uniref:DUF4948 domain-containing protein n=2 Tax=Flavobacteriaceae TaxID=49546 RepID=A0A250F080_CAPSP|nr:hypothetical protein CGC59_02160 [Capnocytophaga sputigena]